MRARGEALHHVAQPTWIRDRAEFCFPLPLYSRGLGGEATEWRWFWRGGGKNGERAQGEDRGEECAHDAKLVHAPESGQTRLVV